MTVQEQNRLLFDRLQFFLQSPSPVVDENAVQEISKSLNMPFEQAYAFMLADALGFSIDTDPDHKEIFMQYFPKMIHELNPAEYESDLYFRTILLPALRRGDWEIKRLQYAPCEAFVCGDLERDDKGRIIPPIGFFRKGFSYPAVLQNGREWMLIAPSEINTMREPIGCMHGKVLTHGLGLGYFAFMVSNKSEVSSVTIVEKDEAVITLFKDHILPQFPCKEKIRIVHADAYAYMETDFTSEGYDCVFTDLWHDAGDGIPLMQKMKGYEAQYPDCLFSYWIDKTMQCYL